MENSDKIQPKALSPSEVTSRFEKMSPLQATRYYNKCMTNPSTSRANVDLLMQYREQNPSRFLSDEEMSAQKNKGSWLKGRGLGGGYRDGSNNRVYDSYGDSYDNNGRSYDRNGREYGGYSDGGPDPDYRNVNHNGFSDFFGAAKQSNVSRGSWNLGRPFKKRDPTVAVSKDEIGTTIKGLGNNVSRTRYFNKVVNNPQSNPETVDNLISFRDANPSLFASEAEEKAAPKTRGGKPLGQDRRGGRYYDGREKYSQPYDGREPNGYQYGNDRYRGNRDYDPRAWASMWKSREEFDAMSPKKKKFFVGAFRRRNRSKNTAYGFRVMVNPSTSSEDRAAMAEVANENPKLFFSKENPGTGREMEQSRY